MKRTRILIAGFGDLGKEFLQVAPSRSFEIHALGRSVEPKVGMNYQSIKGDLSDRISLNSLNKKFFDIIIFCPSPDRRTEQNYIKTYLEGLKNLLSIETIHTYLKKFIFISSTSVYGYANAEWVNEDTQPNPIHFNGKILLKAENYLLSRLKDKSIILRFGGIYGKRESRFLRQIENISPNKVGKEKYTNRIHIRDCALMILHLIHLKKFDPLYMGVDHEPSSLYEMTKWLVQKQDLNLSFMSDPMKDSLVKSSDYVNNKRCKNQKILDTGFEFLYPTYREGYTEILARRK